ncbi:4'-phosphopantetheinyl transferase superfamily protein [Parazoarcus communis]|uniref:4'-phosphopantetheinyl transferase superfamily protein n=1 Tax=Parazoarcus communis TaxID=41977 RepID=UPI0034D1B27D
MRCPVIKPVFYRCWTVKEASAKALGTGMVERSGRDSGIGREDDASPDGEVWCHRLTAAFPFNRGRLRSVHA